MDFVDILVLVVLVVAAIVAYVLYAMRGGREKLREPAIPRQAATRIRIKAPPEKTPVARSDSEQVSPAASPVATSAAAPPLFDLGLDLDLDLGVVSEPVAVTPPAVITWCKQFDSRSKTLDDMARLRLIGDLGVVAKEWCVPLLAQAYQEEERGSHRQAALTALAACHSRAAAGTFRAALAAGDPAERAIGADGLADLEPAQQTKIRRTVERF